MIEFLLNLFKNNYVCFFAGIVVGINIYVILLRNKYVKVFLYKRNCSDLMKKIDTIYMVAVVLSTWMENALNIMIKENLLDKEEFLNSDNILKKAMAEVDSQLKKEGDKLKPPQNPMEL